MKKRLTKKEKAREKLRNSAKKFKYELKKSLGTALVAAFGFIIALSWRDLIVEFLDTITRISPIQGKLISAVIVTIVSVIGILIVTRLLLHRE